MPTGCNDRGSILWVIVHSALYTLLLSIVLFPSVFQPLKYTLLLISLSAILIPVNGSWRKNLHKIIVLWLIYYVCLGVAFSILGLANDAPNIKPILELYVIFPAIYVTILAGINKTSVVYNILRILIFSAFPVSILVILQVLSVWGVSLPGSDFILGLYSSSALTSEISYTPRVLSSLIFIAPFIAGCLVIFTKQTSPVPLPILWIAAIVTLFAVYLSQRRALVLIAAFTPLYTVFFSVFLDRSQKKQVLQHSMKLVALMVVVVGSAHYLLQPIGLGFDSLFQDTAAAFDFEKDPGGSTRMEQISVLITAFQENMLVGRGLGMGVDGYVRDQVSPWNYEMRYIALLYQVGILGFLAYAAGIVWIFLIGMRVISTPGRLANPMFVLLCGLVGALLAEATNPYLNQFGHLWMIFVPLSVLNLWLLQEHQNIDRCIESEREKSN